VTALLTSGVESVADESRSVLRSIVWKVWPPAIIIIGLILTIGWIGLLGYGLISFVSSALP